MSGTLPHWKNRSRLSFGNTLEERKRLLIITQDGESSKAYFEAWRQRLAKGAVAIEVCASPQAPAQLVAAVPGIRKHAERKAGHGFDEVWVLFDRDDFPDFDAAVYALRRMCTEGVFEAWSNECFELWYCLHHQSLEPDCPLTRAQLFEKCTRFLNVRQTYGETSYTHLKGKRGETLHHAMANSPAETIRSAIARATHLEQETPKSNGGPNAQPSRLNPFTKVHKLVQSLMAQSPEFQ